MSERTYDRDDVIALIAEIRSDREPPEDWRAIIATVLEQLIAMMPAGGERAIEIVARDDGLVGMNLDGVARRIRLRPDDAREIGRQLIEAAQATERGVPS